MCGEQRVERRTVEGGRTQGGIRDVSTKLNLEVTCLSSYKLCTAQIKKELSINAGLYNSNDKRDIATTLAS